MGVQIPPPASQDQITIFKFQISNNTQITQIPNLVIAELGSIYPVEFSDVFHTVKNLVPGFWDFMQVGAESEGFEPPWDCSRRISSPLPYQLGLALQTRRGLGARCSVLVKKHIYPNNRMTKPLLCNYIDFVAVCQLIILDDGCLVNIMNKFVIWDL
jgi:hypothetical protein